MPAEQPPQPAEQPSQPGQDPGAPTPAPARGRRSRRALIAGAIAAAVLLASGLAWGAGALFAPGGAFAGPIGPETTRVELPRGEHDLPLALGFDAAATAAAMNDDPNDFSGIVEVFTDPELTRRVDVFASARGERLTLTAVGRDTLRGAGDADEDREIGDTAEGWTRYERLYVARFLGADGAPLAEPRVTEVVTAAQLDAVTPTASTAGPGGTLELSWAPVAGAREYLVVLSVWRQEQGFREFRLLGSTAGTDWSSASLGPVTPGQRGQNGGLQLFAGASEDRADPAGDADRRPLEGAELGVIATDGAGFSPLSPIGAPAGLGALPFEVASAAMRAAHPKELAGRPLSELPTGFPVTGLDGATRTVAMRIDPASVEVGEIPLWSETGELSVVPGFSFRGEGVGTRLGSGSLLTAGEDRAALDRAIAEFNERALREHPAP